MQTQIPSIPQKYPHVRIQAYTFIFPIESMQIVFECTKKCNHFMINKRKNISPKIIKNKITYILIKKRKLIKLI